MFRRHEYVSLYLLYIFHELPGEKNINNNEKVEILFCAYNKKKTFRDKRKPDLRNFFFQSLSVKSTRIASHLQ